MRFAGSISFFGVYERQELTNARSLTGKYFVPIELEL